MFVFNVRSNADSLVIGTDQTNPPMATKTDSASHFIGFEVDIMNEICFRLHLTCIYKAVVTNKIIQKLESKEIDLAISSIIIPNIPIEGLIFSLPYLPSNAQFMTLKSSSIKSFLEISHKTIGVSFGAFQEDLTSDMFLKHIFNSSLKIKGYQNIADLLSALNNRKVDIIFANQVAADYWYYNNTSLYKFIGEPIHTGNGYGILATVKYQDLIQDINTTIHQIMADGTYDRLNERYFLNFD
jgi:arginine transport system substrate-binding protein